MNRLVKAIMALSLSAGVCLSIAGCGQKSTSPVTLPDEHKNNTTVTPPDEQSEYSIITKLDLNINFNGNTVKGTVKNSFTLFPATARVYVYLYFAESYTTDYTKMQEVASAYTDDLDMNKTLTATYEMQGEIGYFLARMRYKIDSRGWEERTTDAYKHSYSGIFMQTIEDDGSLPVFEDVEPVIPYISDLDYKGYERIYYDDYYSFEALSDLQETSFDFENKSVKENIGAINKEFYIFTPKDKKLNSWNQHMKYQIFTNGIEYVFTKSVLLAIPEFDFIDKPESGVDTGIGLRNLRFYFSFIDLGNINLNGKLNLKFGKCEKIYNTGFEKFINIYIGNKCIGTCYYKTDSVKEITYACFYNLFAEGLRVI